MNKYIKILLTIILCALFTVLAGCSLFWGDEEEETPEERVITLSSNNVIFLPTTPTEGILLNVSVSGEAKDKALDYELQWENPNASWALNKELSDYVSAEMLIVGDEGILLLRCTELFNEKIKLTVYLASDPETLETCTVDCRQRLIGASYCFEDQDGNKFAFANDEISDILYEVDMSSSEESLLQSFYFKTYLSGGTVLLKNSEVSVRVRYSSSFYAYLAVAMKMTNTMYSDYYDLEYQGYSGDGSFWYFSYFIIMQANLGLPTSKSFASDWDKLSECIRIYNAISPDSPILEYNVRVSYDGNVALNETIGVKLYIA